MNNACRTGLIISCLMLSSFARTQVVPEFWLPSNGPYTGTINAIMYDELNSLYLGMPSGIIRCPENAYRGVPCDPPVSHVTCFATNSSYELFAGTEGDGVWKSTDHGIEWKQMNDGILDLNIRSLAIDHDDRVYAGTGTGIFASTPSGRSWHRIAPEERLTGVISMASCTDGSVISGSNEGIRRTTDGGRTWNTTRKANFVRTLVAGPNGLVCASLRDEGVFISSDCGSSWRDAGALFRGRDVRALGISMAGTILVDRYPVAVVEESPSRSAPPIPDTLFRSTDHGQTWHAVLTDVPLVSCGVRFDNNLVAGTSGEGLFRSTDDGATWEQVGLPLADVNDLMLGDHGRLLAAVEGRHGILESTNKGASWHTLTRDNSTTSVRMLRRASPDVFLALSGSGLIRSTDRGGSWQPFGRENNLGYVHCMFALSPRDILLGTDKGIFRTQNGGTSWSRTCDALRDSAVKFITEGEKGKIYSGGENTGIYVSSDRGRKWSRLAAPRSSYRSFLVDGSGRYYAGLWLKRSDDGGQSWSTISLGAVNALAVNRLGHVFAGTDNGVFSSTNGGRSWVRLGKELDRLKVNTLAIDSEGHLYAGTRGAGVLRSEYPTVPPSAGRNR